MLVVIFVLPFFSAETYSIVKNTTSQLGAQNTPNSWMMNLVFVLLGLGSILGGWNILKGYWFHRVVLAVFGFSLILTAFYHHAPINPETNYDKVEDQLHSLFATITGFSFTMFSISTAFILRNKFERIFAIGIGVLATFLTFLLFNVDEFSGIWQRLIFITSFLWMIHIFRAKEKLINPI